MFYSLSLTDQEEKKNEKKTIFGNYEIWPTRSLSGALLTATK